MGMAAPVKKERLDATAWADAALAALAEHGVAGVAVEPLARALGVTKGSFYWHFKTRDELLLAAVERWETLATAGVIERVTHIEPPQARIRALMRVAHASQSGIRIAAQLAPLAEHKTIGPVLKRLTARRIEFIAQCYRDLGLNAARARRAAQLAYAAYLGLAELERLGLGLGTARQRAEYVAQVVSTLVPAETSPL